MAELDQPGQEGTVLHGFQEAPPAVLGETQQNDELLSVQLPGGQSVLVPKPNPVHDYMLAERLKGKSWPEINGALQGLNRSDGDLHGRLRTAVSRNLATANGSQFTQLPGGGDERG